MIIVIPARLNSTRMTHKLLADIAGKSVLQRTYENARQTDATRIVIAADHQDIIHHARAFCDDVLLTDVAHASGTDRLGEVVDQLSLPDDEIIVNVQGDEPFLPAKYINQCANELSKTSARVATLACKVNVLSKAVNLSSVVKVVLDKNGHALYFSRATIPFHRDKLSDLSGQTVVPKCLHHLGVYAYRANFLRTYQTLSESPLEQIEKLEQLRILWHGYAIKVGQVDELPAMGIDTEADLARARAYVSS